MRGLVFNEFLDFVESAAGPDMVETMIGSAALGSGGAYTRVGNYDHGELVAMLSFLHQATGQEVGSMVHAFGRHLFGQFQAGYPDYFRDIPSVLDFLEHVETHVHVEVRKLYPDAELPSLKAERPEPSRLRLQYLSSRPFADLCHGLIEGALHHFGGHWTLTREDGAGSAGTSALFEIRAA